MIRLPDGIEWWHVATLAAAVGAGVGYTFSGSAKADTPLGDEDLQLHSTATGLPSEFWHMSPVSWAGRKKTYPGTVGQGLASLQDRSAPDWADCDR